MKGNNSLILGLFFFISAIIIALSNRYEYGNKDSNYHYVMDKWTGDVYLTSANRNWVNEEAEGRAEVLRILDKKK
tara:strand:- start:188 stop:412 length:225 start_codon:yes stop_codon:yes gene_type:complete